MYSSEDLDMSQSTNENNKRIAKNTFLLYIRMFFIMAVSLFTSRVVLRTLGVTDFGIYNVVGGVVAMMGILNSAMAVSTQRYLTFELGKGDMVRLKQTFSVCFSIYVMLSILIVFLAETVGLWFVNNKLVIPEDRMIAVNWLYQFSILTCVNSLLSAPYNAVLIAREKMNVYAYVGVFEVLLRLGIVYLLLIIPYDRLIVYGALFMFSTLITTMAYRLYCIRQYPESRYSFYWEKPLIQQILTYSGWNIFGSLSGLVKGQGLNILLNMFFSPAVNASGGIAYQVNAAITQFFTNFYTAVKPQITKYYAQNDLENMFRLVFRSSKYSFYLILLMSLPIVIETPYIIQLWLGQLPEYVVEFTRIIVLITAIDAMANPLMTTAHATGNIRLYQSLVGTMVICNVPISYLLLRYGDFPPTIVFGVSTGISLAALFVRLWIVKRLVDFPVVKYIKNVFVKCLLIACLASCIPVLIYQMLEVNFGSFCLVLIISVMSVLLVIFTVGMSLNERKYIIDAIKNRIRK